MQLPSLKSYFIIFFFLRHLILQEKLATDHSARTLEPPLRVPETPRYEFWSRVDTCDDGRSAYKHCDDGEPTVSYYYSTVRESTRMNHAFSEIARNNNKKKKIRLF